MSKITRLLSFEIDNIKRYKNGKFSFSFLNYQNVANSSMNDDIFKVSNTLYTNKVLAILGTNASGKTTAIKMIDLICEIYCCNQNLNTKNVKSFLKTIYYKGPIDVVLYYTINKSIYCLESQIAYESTNDAFRYTNEKVYKKKLKTNSNKANYKDMTTFVLQMERNKLSEDMKAFLEFDKSISWSTIGEGDRSRIANFYQTEATSIILKKHFPIEVIKYLDKTIEEIDVKNTSNVLNEQFILKFSGEDEMLLTAKELWNTISSGTQKGLEVFDEIIKTLISGGYYIIDEIENHFHKTIVLDILKLFKYSDTNPLGATLLFSTHYAEIVDSIERNDSIYIATKDESSNCLSLTNYSELQKRNDLKKSEWYLTDAGKIGTTIKYEKFTSLRKSVKKSLDASFNKSVVE